MEDECEDCNGGPWRRRGRIARFVQFWRAFSQDSKAHARGRAPVNFGEQFSYPSWKSTRFICQRRLTNILSTSFWANRLQETGHSPISSSAPRSFGRLSGRQCSSKFNAPRRLSKSDQPSSQKRRSQLLLRAADMSESPAGNVCLIPSLWSSRPGAGVCLSCDGWFLTRHR